MFLGHRKLKQKENKSQNKYVRLVDEASLTSKTLLRCAIKTELRNSGLAQQYTQKADISKIPSFSSARK